LPRPGQAEAPRLDSRHPGLYRAVGSRLIQRGNHDDRLLARRGGGLRESERSRRLEVQNVKLEIEPSTTILVDCKKASMTELKDAAEVKAVYEVKDDRNIATVLEAEKK